MRMNRVWLNRIKSIIMLYTLKFWICQIVFEKVPKPALLSHLFAYRSTHFFRCFSLKEVQGKMTAYVTITVHPFVTPFERLLEKKKVRSGKTKNMHQGLYKLSPFFQHWICQKKVSLYTNMYGVPVMFSLLSRVSIHHQIGKL